MLSFSVFVLFFPRQVQLAVGRHILGVHAGGNSERFCSANFTLCCNLLTAYDKSTGATIVYEHGASIITDRNARLDVPQQGDRRRTARRTECDSLRTPELQSPRKLPASACTRTRPLDRIHISTTRNHVPQLETAEHDTAKFTRLFLIIFMM